MHERDCDVARQPNALLGGVIHRCGDYARTDHAIDRRRLSGLAWRASITSGCPEPPDYNKTVAGTRSAPELILFAGDYSDFRLRIAGLGQNFRGVLAEGGPWAMHVGGGFGEAGRDRRDHHIAFDRMLE